MIEVKKGDIFSEKTEAIVIPVNCVGVCGKGLAYEFRRRFYTQYALYCRACEKNEIKIGEIYIHRTERGQFKFILLFPTKEHWRDESKIEDIEAGLNTLIHVIEQYSIKSISIPALGCGCGHLSWHKVKDLMIAKLIYLEDVKIVIFEPM